MTAAPPHRPTDSAPPAPQAPGRRARRRHLRRTGAVLALGTALFAAGALGLAPDRADPPTGGRRAPAASSEDTAQRRIEALRQQIRRTGKNPRAWAELGLEYVQQAKTTADPAYYPKAGKSLRRSLDLQPRDNFTAEVGLGALAAGRHEFRDALRWARRATRTNPANAAARGVLGDAYTQLGRYRESFQAVQKMVDLQPGTPSLARASYTWELRGETDRARALMRRALKAASDPGDTAFARYHLAGLALRSGAPSTALREANAGLRSVPDNPDLLEVRARARTALGRPAAAVDDFEQAIAHVPQPAYVIALGELQQARGHLGKARRQYALYRTQERLLQQAGVRDDAEAVLFEADHGDADRAVGLGRRAVRSRPFLASHDAYAWALHRAGRDREALSHAEQALRLGTRSALYLYHRGMIHHALGDHAAARTDLRAALRTDPHFHPLHAPAARRTLTRIGAEA
ncbi:tetratricopeptide repeat protein [Streptomyces sp. AA1529]|uniref:tetratricopeptide repeat protein n=1 Tax=Streptomyces sp. AA1529 TaxID=1203257 RepID=UPI003D72E728